MKIQNHVKDDGFASLEHPAHTLQDDVVEIPLAVQSSALGSYPDAVYRPGTSALWIGERHHLDREEVAQFVLHLQCWLETGSLKIKVANVLREDGPHSKEFHSLLDAQAEQMFEKERQPEARRSAEKADRPDEEQAFVFYSGMRIEVRNFSRWLPAVVTCSEFICPFDGRPHTMLKAIIVNDNEFATGESWAGKVHWLDDVRPRTIKSEPTRPPVTVTNKTGRQLQEHAAGSPPIGRESGSSRCPE